MSTTLYYILSTKNSDCLNELIETGTYRHIRNGQPDSGPFLNAVLSSTRPDVRFALFDRVSGSDNYWKISAIYRLKDISKDDKNEDAKNDHYKLSLDLDTENAIVPLDFDQDSRLWSEISKTRDKKTTNLYNSRRVLLPITKEDFDKILSFSSHDQSSNADIADAQRPSPRGVPFKLESDLRDFVAENLEIIEPGLQPWDDAFIEKDAGTLGRIDIFAKAKDGCPVIIELKKGHSDDEVVGQICRYITWAKDNIVNGGTVRGIIIANVVSEKLKASARAVPNLSLSTYEIQFKIKSVS